MTSKRDPMGRDWGPLLAIAGALVVVGAVIAGFIAVGGPGDARDRRLDEQMTRRLYDVASMAQCAYAQTGKAAADIGEMHSTIASAAKSHPDKPPCAYYTADSGVAGADYTRLSDHRIRLCGEFRRPYDPETASPAFRYQDHDLFPEFGEARPAGRHCYEIDLGTPGPAVAN